MSCVFQVIDEYSSDVHFVEIDIEEDPEIAEAGGIMGTPCVQFFKNKQMIKYVVKSLTFCIIIIIIIIFCWCVCVSW